MADLDLVEEWNTRNPKQRINRRLVENDKLWQFIKKTLHMKRCACGLKGTVNTVELQHLLTEHSKHNSESTSLNIATDRLKSDLQLIEKETIDLKLSNKDTSSSCDQITFKVEILKARAQQYKEEIRAINEYSERLDKIIRSDEQIDHHDDRQRDLHEDRPRKQSGKIESDCNELLEMFRNSSAHKDSESQKETNWLKAESILVDHTPKTVWKSFTVLTEQSATELRTRLKGLNEAPSSHGSRPSSSNRLHSLEKHIEELQLQHISQSQDLLHTRKQLQALKHQQNNLTQLWKMLITKHPLVNKDLLFDWLQSSLELTGFEVVLRELDMVCDNMKRYQQERREMADMIEAKNTRITEFKDVVEEKQKVIRDLVKHNAAAKERLKQQQTQTQLYLTQKLRPLNNMSTIFINLKDHILREVTLFTASPKYGSTGNSCSVTTYHSMVKTCGGAGGNDGVENGGGAAVLKCPESLLIESMDRLKTDKLLAHDHEEIKSELHQMKCNQDKLEEFATILKESDVFIEQHEGPICSQLEAILTVASKGVASLADTESVLQEWWVQPAQGLVHWKTVEDMNVDQWVNQWQILATKYTTLTTESSAISQSAH